MEVRGYLEDALVNDRSGYIAVMASLIVLTRQEGREVPAPCIAELRQFTNGELKRAIKVIRKIAPEITLSPAEDMIHLLRVEVMGKHDALLHEVATEARETFPEYFTGKADKEIISEIARSVRKSGEITA